MGQSEDENYRLKLENEDLKKQLRQAQTTQDEIRVLREETENVLKSSSHDLSEFAEAFKKAKNHQEATAVKLMDMMSKLEARIVTENPPLQVLEADYLPLEKSSTPPMVGGGRTRQMLVDAVMDAQEGRTTLIIVHDQKFADLCKQNMIVIAKVKLKEEDLLFRVTIIPYRDFPRLVMGKHFNRVVEDEASVEAREQDWQTKLRSFVRN